MAKVFLSVRPDFGINFVSTWAGNWLGSKVIPINSGWFKPQHFGSVFTKSYGQKILSQTAVGAGLSGVVNFTRKFDWGSVDWSSLVPTIPAPVVPALPIYWR